MSDETDIQITETGRALVAFTAWHDERWPRPHPSDPYHWKSGWHSDRRARWLVWLKAWESATKGGEAEQVENDKAGSMLEAVQEMDAESNPVESGLAQFRCI